MTIQEFWTAVDSSDQRLPFLVCVMRCLALHNVVAHYEVHRHLDFINYEVETCYIDNTQLRQLVEDEWHST